MKKIIALLLWAGIAPLTYANPLVDQIDAAFVGHAKFSTEFVTEGFTQVQFLSNFIEIGHLNGQPVAAIDSGILGNILPNTNQLSAANFTSGAKIHLAPFIKSYITLQPEWQFLNTLEIDARASYNWTLHHPFYGVAIAYPFK